MPVQVNVRNVMMMTVRDVKLTTIKTNGENAYQAAAMETSATAPPRSVTNVQRVATPVNQ